MRQGLLAASQVAALSSMLGLGAGASTPSAQGLFQNAGCAELGEDRVLALRYTGTTTGGGTAGWWRFFPTTDPKYATLLRLVGEITPRGAKAVKTLELSF